MQGSSTVLSALNDIYTRLLTYHEQSHRQENRFEAMGWCGLKKRFDRQTSKADGWIHGVLDRIEELSGTPNSAMGSVLVADDPSQAFTNALNFLTGLSALYVAATTAAMADKDTCTAEMLIDHYTSIERQMLKFEREIRKLNAMQLALYLASRG